MKRSKIELTGKVPKIVTVDDANLTMYATTKDDKSKGITNKMPKEAKEESSGGGGKKRSETLYSHNKKEVSVDDFKVLAVLGRGAFGKVLLVEPKSGEGNDEL